MSKRDVDEEKVLGELVNSPLPFFLVEEEFSVAVSGGAFFLNLDCLNKVIGTKLDISTNLENKYCLNILDSFNVSNGKLAIKPPYFRQLFAHDSFLRVPHGN